MTTKQALLERLVAETKAGINFSNKAIEFAKAGRISKAWDMLDTAKCALTCTNQVHEQLWEFTKGDLTDEEFDIFCQSETVTTVFNQAVKVVKTAMKGA
ncbi:hypothetical protein [Streptococcus suis]